MRVATHMLRHYIIIEYVATREDLYLATHSFFILWVTSDTLEEHADLSNKIGVGAVKFTNKTNSC